MRYVYAVTAALATALISGCGQPTVQETQADFCQELAGLGKALKELTAIRPDSTVGDLKGAQKDLQQAMKGVSDAAATIQDAKVSELEAAYNNLDKGINDISNNQTLAEAQASIADELATVNNAWAQANSSANCGP
jgi:hypothetical protein